jgi:hypothetical protein
VDGHDAAYKLSILASMAFDSHFDYREIHTEGIRGVTAGDIAIAKSYGFVIKLLAIGVAHDDRVELRVHPVMLSKRHPLAAVNDSFNAVFARGNFVGDVMFYGRGAGQLPTASAIVGDIIDLAMHQAKGGTSPRMNFGSLKKAVVPMGEVKTQFYLRLDVKDQPGVLASITKIFGDCGVSISAVTQKEATGESVELVIFTHEVAEADFQKAAGIGIRRSHPVVVGVRSSDPSESSACTSRAPRATAADLGIEQHLVRLAQDGRDLFAKRRIGERRDHLGVVEFGGARAGNPDVVGAHRHVALLREIEQVVGQDQVAQP